MNRTAQIINLADYRRAHAPRVTMSVPVWWPVWPFIHFIEVTL